MGENERRREEKEGKENIGSERRRNWDRIGFFWFSLLLIADGPIALATLCGLARQIPEPLAVFPPFRRPAAELSTDCSPPPPPTLLQEEEKRCWDQRRSR